jgi:hypothetical protein
MTAQSPVLLKPCFDLPEIVLAKDQPEYIPLPVLISRCEAGVVTSRWKFTFRERISILFSGNIWIQQLCFHKAVTPLKPSTTEPEVWECL